MSHGVDLPGVAELHPAAPPERGIIGLIDKGMTGLNLVISVVGGVALVVASCILSYSVVTRYFLKLPTDWQDEASVFFIVGAVFMSAAGVQARRGHVAIEAVASLLPPAVNRVRLMIVDFLCAVFCLFFAWKSWTLLHEAWTEDQHSISTWGPPLWIPYSLMAVGMSLLTLQICLQLVSALLGNNKST